MYFEGIYTQVGGFSVAVNDENKMEYAQLITELKTTKAIENQLSAFLQVTSP